MHRKRTRAATLAIGLAIPIMALAACGGGSDAPPAPASGGGPQAAATVSDPNRQAIEAAMHDEETQAALIEHLIAKGARPDPAGTDERDLLLPAGGPSCSSAVLFTNPAQVEFALAGAYAGTVVNPARTAGVKPSSTQEDAAACATAFAAALEGFEHPFLEGAGD